MRFIKIQAYNGIDNESSLSDETIIIRRYPAPLSTTTSSFAFSFIGETGTITPPQILNRIGDCDVIAQWSNSTQGWESIGNMPALHGGWENSSYPFEKSEPFILNSTDNLEDVFLVKNIDMNTYVTPTYTVSVGTAVTGHSYTMVTVPYNTAITNEVQLMSSIWTDDVLTVSSEITVSKLDQKNQVWETYSYDGSGDGDSFAIYPGDVIKVGAVGAVAATFDWQE